MSETTDADQQGAVSPVDRVVTVLFLVGLAVLAPIAGFMGLLTSMASDGCMGGDDCNSGLIGLGVAVSALSPALVALVTLGWVVKRWRTGRATWWVPLVALPAGAGSWLLGALITSTAVG